jgi:hypothetical protein
VSCRAQPRIGLHRHDFESGTNHIEDVCSILEACSDRAPQAISPQLARQHCRPTNAQCRDHRVTRQSGQYQEPDRAHSMHDDSPEALRPAESLQRTSPVERREWQQIQAVQNHQRECRQPQQPARPISLLNEQQQHGQPQSRQRAGQQHREAAAHRCVRRPPDCQRPQQRHEKHVNITVPEGPHCHRVTRLVQGHRGQNQRCDVGVPNQRHRNKRKQRRDTNDKQQRPRSSRGGLRVIGDVQDRLQICLDAQQALTLGRYPRSGGRPCLAGGWRLCLELSR